MQTRTAYLINLAHAARRATAAQPLVHPAQQAIIRHPKSLSDTALPRLLCILICGYSGPHRSQIILLRTNAELLGLPVRVESGNNGNSAVEIPAKGVVHDALETVFVQVLRLTTYSMDSVQASEELNFDNLVPPTD